MKQYLVYEGAQIQFGIYPTCCNQREIWVKSLQREVSVGVYIYALDLRLRERRHYVPLSVRLQRRIYTFPGLSLLALKVVCVAHEPHQRDWASYLEAKLDLGPYRFWNSVLHCGFAG